MDMKWPLKNFKALPVNVNKSIEHQFNEFKINSIKL